MVTELKSIRAARLKVGGTYFAMIWHRGTRRRDLVEVKILKIEGVKPKLGMKIYTDKFVFFNIEGGMNVEMNDKINYVTFQEVVEKAKTLSATTSKAAVEEKKEVTEEATKAPKKRVRKPLTAKQKARKNELARARRAAKKAAKA